VLGVPLVETRYDDVATLTQTLAHNKVHTVISALSMMPDTGGPLEANLIAAADASQTTVRMIASDYGFPQHTRWEDMAHPDESEYVMNNIQQGCRRFPLHSHEASLTSCS
jgi:hypothetical protein